MLSFLGMDWESSMYLGLSFFMFVGAKYVNEWMTPYDDNVELRDRKNTAVAISMAGYLIGVGIILLGALLGPKRDLISDLYGFLGYGFLGIVALNYSRIINDKIIFRRFCNVKELVEDRNIGAGFIEFGSYVASALVIAGAIHGEGGDVSTSFAFYLTSQAALIIFAFIYNKLTPFNLYDEIERDNAAVGIAFGGTLIALGIILLKGISGNFIGWTYNFINFSFSVLFSLISLPLLRFLTDKVIIPQIDLNKAIALERNIAISIIEVIIAIVFATLIFFTIDFHINL